MLNKTLFAITLLSTLTASASANADGESCRESINGGASLAGFEVVAQEGNAAILHDAGEKVAILSNGDSAMLLRPFDGDVSADQIRVFNRQETGEIVQTDSGYAIVVPVEQCTVGSLARGLLYTTVVADALPDYPGQDTWQQPERVVMFGTEWCPACEDARDWFDAHGIEYHDLNPESSSRAEALMTSLAEDASVDPEELDAYPIIFVGNQMHKGFTRRDLAKDLDIEL